MRLHFSKLTKFKTANQLSGFFFRGIQISRSSLDDAIGPNAIAKLFATNAYEGRHNIKNSTKVCPWMNRKSRK
jgi:hypothetical protein